VVELSPAASVAHFAGARVNGFPQRVSSSCAVVAVGFAGDARITGVTALVSGVDSVSMLQFRRCAANGLRGSTSRPTRRSVEARLLQCTRQTVYEDASTQETTVPDTRRTFASVILSLLTLVACSEQDDPKPDTASSPLPHVSTMTKRTVKVSKEKSEGGKATFTQYCAGCHGESAEGRVGIAPSLNSDSFLAAAGDEFLIRTLQQGRSGTTMVSWGLQIPRHKAEELVSFLRELNPVEPADLDESPSTGDPGKGELVFRNTCSPCHGASGRGYQESASGTAIRGRDFLTSVSNGFLRHLIHHGKTGTKMKPLSSDSRISVTQLSEAEIEDVISFLRNNPND